MAHIPLDRRSLVIVIAFALFFTILSVIPATARADTNNTQMVTQLSIDGDYEAYKQWQDWSNYYSYSNGSINQYDVHLSAPDGTQLLLFNSWMFHGAEGGGWERLSANQTTITIRNVIKYAVGATIFRDSNVIIDNCKEVVLGAVFTDPANHNSGGFLTNTQVVVSNFEKLWIYNFTYTKSGGRPLEITGNGNSTVVIKALYVHPSTMVNGEGVGIRNVGLLRFNVSHNALLITNHTPALVLENVKHIRMDPWSDLVINNLYYDVGEGKWTKTGVGILTENVKKIDGDFGIRIYNCNVGIAFEDNGTGEALNDTWYVHFHNCTHNYAYKYSYTSLPAGMGDLMLGFQAITGVFVALAWFRIGVNYVSERRERKEMAKGMMGKAAIGSLIVAIIAYGYYIMIGLVNWIFGGS